MSRELAERLADEVVPRTGWDRAEFVDEVDRALRSAGFLPPGQREREPRRETLEEELDDYSELLDDSEDGASPRGPAALDEMRCSLHGRIAAKDVQETGGGLAFHVTNSGSVCGPLEPRPSPSGAGQPSLTSEEAEAVLRWGACHSMLSPAMSKARDSGLEKLRALSAPRETRGGRKADG
jgi:hypothetical protein